MINPLLIIIGSFLPLILLNLFADSDPSLAQPQMGGPPMGEPQMGQPQRGASSGQNLEEYSLPPETITENDVPGIKAVIRKVLEKISESTKSSGTRADYQTIRSCILTFQDWLKTQGCVSEASTTYNIETVDKYPENIFLTHPGQLPFEIVFKMEGNIEKPYRLLIFVTTADMFNFGSLVEDKSLSGVPVPENWPKDTWSYWEDRP